MNSLDNIKLYKDLENKKPLFEMVDMGYISFEFGFTLIFMMGVFVLSYKFENIEITDKMKLFIQFGLFFLFFRQLGILYKAFILKLYHLKFYENGIYRVENNEFIPIDSVKSGNNIFWCLSSNELNSYWNPIKFLIVILFVPLQIILFFLFVAKWFTTIFYSKSFKVNQYSLIVHFNYLDGRGKVLNIPYGYLKKEEKEFIKNYFSRYFNIDTLEKSFLILPTKEEED